MIKSHNMTTLGTETRAEVITIYLDFIAWLETIGGLTLVKTYDNSSYQGTGEHLYVHSFSHNNDTSIYLVFGLQYASGAYISGGYASSPVETGVLSAILNRQNVRLSSTVTTNSSFTAVYPDNKTLFLCGRNNHSTSIAWEVGINMLCAKTTSVEGVDGKTYIINGTASTTNSGYFNSSIPNSKQIGNFIMGKKSSHLTKAFKMNAIIINASNYTEFETCDSLYNILATNTVAGNVITIGGSQYGFIVENLAIKI